MSDLTELYQELIIDHSRKPRNFRALASPDRQVEGFNPLCGDRFTIYLDLEGDVIQDVSFQGSGCAISTASASLMTQALKGKSRQEAEELFRRFQRMITGEVGEAEAEQLGKLAVFAGVRKFPVRVKCATLSWHAIHAALHGERQPVSTE